MPLNQAQFCSILSKLQQQSATRKSNVSVSDYGFSRLAGSIALAKENIVDSIQNAKDLAIPIDTNIYTELIALCPGLLPKLPKDTQAALLAVSALQALVSANSPGKMLNTMLNDPLGRLKNVQATLKGIVDQVKSNISTPSSLPEIPGDTITKSATKLLSKEAKIFATQAITDALEKVGIDPIAADRCAGSLCAVSFKPPG